ncbi:MAG: ABC transporter permease [Bacteroidetes bacterium 43-93]|nr:ABC transporter permease [Bacteroidota bacterium]OJW97641.1 MAG: ABC transporter permease [Bacteroidetes bacterium 43-93]
MHSEEKDWSLIIKPRGNLFELNLEELWHYRDLVWLLVKRDFVSFYKQTIFGPIWFFIQPIFTTIIFVLVFGNLAGFSTDGLPQPLFYMTNIVAWNYFSDCINKTSTVFKDNAQIFGKVYFPRLIMPFSIVISNLVRFGVQFILLIIMMAYYILFKGYHPNFTWYLLLYPVMIVLMAALGLGSGMIISAMTTKYRDLSFLVSFGVQLYMYITPIIYPLSSFPAKYKKIALLNPMSPIIEGMRLGLLGKGDLTTGTFIYTVVVVLVVLTMGIIIFNKVEKTFVDTV